MSRRRSIVSWLLNLRLEPLVTRLNEVEALSLAAASAQVAALDRALPVATVRQDAGGRMVWHVSSDGVGAQWWVEVDDATGIVGEVRHVATC